jgi:transcriptional regulator with XRE-family HTH domain
MVRWPTRCVGTPESPLGVHSREIRRVSSTLTKVSTDPKDRWRDLGSFIREQRGTARLSLRRLSELAGISNPYLSQIERGLRRPSAEILQQIAKALRISAETLYVQAGILEPPDGTPDLTRLILADQTLSEDQKQALVRIYLSFRRDHENGHDGHGHDHGHDHGDDHGHEHRHDTGEEGSHPGTSQTPLHSLP